MTRMESKDKEQGLVGVESLEGAVAADNHILCMTQEFLQNDVQAIDNISRTAIE